MNASGLTNPPSIVSTAPSNFPVESEPPSSGSLPADLTGTHQAATSQSLGSGTLADWARIRREFTPTESLMDRWRSHALVDTVDNFGFGKDVKRFQDSLAEEGKDPTLVTSALAARIHDLPMDSRVRALKLLFGLNGGPEGVTFDKNKLKTLAASLWFDCFLEDQKDEVSALIERLPSAG